MSGRVYLDTSALAKWYINEKNSDKIESFIQEIDVAAISSLTKVEMRCLLARRRRMKEVSPKLEMQIYSTFENDIDQGYLSLYKVDDEVYPRAEHLISALNNESLRTLDALHLAVAQYHHISDLATADEVMAKSARILGMQVHLF